MADSPAKRMREAKKREKREMKAERKRLRKEGLLGNEGAPAAPPGETPVAPTTPPTEQPQS
jgi:hypothetical protein